MATTKTTKKTAKAGKAKKSGKLSAADVAELRRLILGAQSARDAYDSACTVAPLPLAQRAELKAKWEQARDARDAFVNGLAGA